MTKKKVEKVTQLRVWTIFHEQEETLWIDKSWDDWAKAM